MVRRTTVDGRAAVVKEPPYDALTEAVGLRALEAAGARVPRILSVSPDRLVLEEVQGDGDWEACARRLAQVHQATGPAFGWDNDGVIGRLPMETQRTEDWPTFYARHRLAPYVDRLPADATLRIVEAIEDGRLAALLDHDVVPALVHGDLWAGNVVGGEYLIDPAVHHADRELDLAFARFFGGFPPAFFAAYEEVLPLDDGWEERLPALQLFHALVHVQQEGDHYLHTVTERLDRLGW